MLQDGCLGEALKAVFPLLSEKDLGSCMCVCKRWRDVARDDYLWKQLCATRWPSVCIGQGSMGKSSSRPYYSLFSSFGGEVPRSQSMPSSKLTFEDLEFYVDIWSGSRAVYSAVVHGPLVRGRVGEAPPGLSESMQEHLQSEHYKLRVAVAPLFSVHLGDSLRVSLLLRRRDDDRMACIINSAYFKYLDGGYLAHAYGFLQISPLYSFVSLITVWVTLLLVDAQGEDMHVFGIELDFADRVSSDRELLCLLEVLDWKSIV